MTVVVIVPALSSFGKVTQIETILFVTLGALVTLGKNSQGPCRGQFSVTNFPYANYPYKRSHDTQNNDTQH
jgi:hypothetical protein